jgi:hypothetical protein
MYSSLLFWLSPYIDSQHIFNVRISNRTSRTGALRNYFFLLFEFQQQNRIFDQSIGIWELTSLMGDATDLESIDTDSKSPL